jgi:hypothetical protein
MRTPTITKAHSRGKTSTNGKAHGCMKQHPNGCKCRLVCYATGIADMTRSSLWHSNLSKRDQKALILIQTILKKRVWTPTYLKMHQLDWRLPWWPLGTTKAKYSNKDADKAQRQSCSKSRIEEIEVFGWQFGVDTARQDCRWCAPFGTMTEQCSPATCSVDTS